MHFLTVSKKSIVSKIAEAVSKKAPLFIGCKIHTEYARAKVLPHNGNDPPPTPGSLNSASVSTPIKRSTKQGDARGTSEVRRGTSPIHFHCPVPQRTLPVLKIL